MKIQRKEFHQVSITHSFHFDEEQILEFFDSIDRFKQIAAIKSGEEKSFDYDPITEEEQDCWDDLFCENEPYQSDEDWVSERKGFTHVVYYQDETI